MGVAVIGADEAPRMRRVYTAMCLECYGIRRLKGHFHCPYCGSIHFVKQWYMQPVREDEQ